MPVRIVQVDSFTEKPYAGNPAAVCVLPQAREDQWMRNVAAEMNLSETAFLHPDQDGFRLRWFTPSIEVDLCGHATLASAHVLWEDGHLDRARAAVFHTRSGTLTCNRVDGWIEMDFPAKIAGPADPPPQLGDALGTAMKYVGRNAFDYLIEVEDEDTVRSLQPKHHLLRELPVRGVIVTAPGTAYDFVSRFFAPGSGIDEDPVTGSAHCALAPYWSARFGKTEMTGYQASARGGVVKVRVDGDRVKLGGQAVTILRGELLQ